MKIQNVATMPADQLDERYQDHQVNSAFEEDVNVMYQLDLSETCGEIYVCGPCVAKLKTVLENAELPAAGVTNADEARNSIPSSPLV